MVDEPDDKDESERDSFFDVELMNVGGFRKERAGDLFRFDKRSFVTTFDELSLKVNSSKVAFNFLKGKEAVVCTLNLSFMAVWFAKLVSDLFDVV